MSDTAEHQIEQALAEAVRSYFTTCRQRAPLFVDHHFRYPGAWRTNKNAFGWDLIRAPINLFWAPIYLSLRLIALLLQKAGGAKLAESLRRIPSGVTTDIQRYLSRLTFTELLGRNFELAEQDDLYSCLNNAMLHVTNTEELHKEQAVALEHIIHDALEQYRITRTASADISNSLLSTIVGGFTFQKFTPGGFAVGIAIASWLAQQLAVDSFIFGNWAGQLYYSIFSANPSFEMKLLSIVLVMTFLAIFASFSGLITDPIQCWMGIHKKRLSKMIDRLEKDFLEKKVGGFRPKDQFIARVLEVVDAAKAHLF